MVIYSCDGKLNFQMLIWCSRKNSYDYHQSWQLCCLIFLWKWWYFFQDCLMI